MSGRVLYDVFIRRWWKDNPAWPNGLEPHPRARKTYLAHNVPEDEAQAICQEYSRTHRPGRYSLKAEYERA